MNNILGLAKSRRSVRSFDQREISEQDMQKLSEFLPQTSNPYSIPVEFCFLDAKKDKLTCPVVIGTDTYIGGKISICEHMNEAFGYSFEKLVLYAQSIGIGTVWLGGTMDRAAFEQAMKLSENEAMPCASPLGYPAKKMSLREEMMRKAIKADSRMDFEELFFDDSFEVPLSQEKVGELADAFEAVRLAPSAVNKQPWRIVRCDDTFHFFLKRSKGFGGGTLDMQKIDMGIALCHFDLAAREKGYSPSFVINEPESISSADVEYIASFVLSK